MCVVPPAPYSKQIGQRACGRRVLQCCLRRRRRFVCTATTVTVEGEGIWNGDLGLRKMMHVRLGLARATGVVFGAQPPARKPKGPCHAQSSARASCTCSDARRRAGALYIGTCLGVERASSTVVLLPGSRNAFLVQICSPYGALHTLSVESTCACMV